MNARRLPCDFDLERTILAELAYPLHPPAPVVCADDFGEGRHARIVSALLSGEPLSFSDKRYAEDCARWAFPVTAGAVDRLRAIAARRRRILALAADIEALLADGCST